MQVELKVNDKSVQAEISEGQLKELGLVEQLKRWDCLRINLKLDMKEWKRVKSII